MLRKIALLGAAFLISTTVDTLAAVAPPPGTDLTSWPLGGITAFVVDVLPLDDDAAKCGITRDSLDTSLRFVLGQSRIRTLSAAQSTGGTGNDGFLNLTVTVLPNCARDILLEAFMGVTIVGTNRFTLAPVWENLFIQTGADAVKGASDAVEQLAKKFVNDWNSANPPPPRP